MILIVCMQNLRQPLGYKRRIDFDFQKASSNNSLNNYWFIHTLMNIFHKEASKTHIHTHPGVCVCV